MIIQDLLDIILRLRMAGKEGESDILFDSGDPEAAPLRINGVYLDEDGDLCLESDERKGEGLSISDIADVISMYDRNTVVYFLSVSRKGEKILFNIKDGGTRDLCDPELRKIPVSMLHEALSAFDGNVRLHFESGSINFTINSVYLDGDGNVCLESNEVMELDDYIIGDLLDELSPLSSVSYDHGTLRAARVYFYDDDSGEYYGIYPDEVRTDADGEVWIKVR